MAEKVIKTTFKLRRGKAEFYATKNITLAAGEPAFELDTGRLKIGDGNTEWNKLPYIYDKEFVYKPGGSMVKLPELNNSNIGYVYNIQEGFTTSDSFIEGAGIKCPAGTDVTIIKIDGKLKYNVYGGFADLSNYAKTSDLNSKEDSMSIFYTWPGESEENNGESEENNFKNNSIYNINIDPEETDRTVGFDDGDSSDDMLYICVNSGDIQSDNISIDFRGNNYLGLNSPFSISPNYLYEIIGIWNPSLHKWIFNTRSL